MVLKCWRTAMRASRICQSSLRLHRLNVGRDAATAGRSCPSSARCRRAIIVGCGLDTNETAASRLLFRLVHDRFAILRPLGCSNVLPSRGLSLRTPSWLRTAIPHESNS